MCGLFTASFVVLSGCNLGDSCREVELVISSSASEPGAIRAAMWLGSATPAITARPDGGVVCVTCTGLLRLDAQLHEDERIGSLRHPMHVALGPDGTAYTTVLVPRDNTASPFSYEVVALDPSGSERWRTRLGPNLTPQALAADASRVYVAVAFGTAAPSIAALDSARGESIWQRPEELLGVAHEGVFTVAPGNQPILHHLDPTGAVVWERTLKSESSSVTVQDAVVTPTGGAIVVGRAGSSVDFGDRVLQGTAGRALNFVVEIDASGATQWAFQADVMYLEHVALTEQREILLGGKLDDRPDHPDLIDEFVALATPQGIVRTHRIGGAGSQHVEDLQAAADGVGWVQVSSYYDDEVDPPPSLRVGGHQLDEPGTYLLGIVP